MLKDFNSSAIVAVTNLNRAREFYGAVLGLEGIEEKMGPTLTYKTGNTYLIVYESKYAGTNKANAVVWGVGDEIDEITAKLKSKGVKFEHYTDDQMSLQGDIHVSGSMKMVWFKDPDGNILHLNNI